MRRVKRDDGKIALTFDDCNIPAAWESILDHLNEHGVRGTFFPIGEEVMKHPELMRRTVDEGHTVGSHGWDHARLKGLPVRQTWRRVRADARLMRDLVGVSTAPFFRPPYCAYDNRVLLGASLARHHRIVLWDVDSCDWEISEPEEIERRVLSGARSGSIILLHTREQTAAALPRLIPNLLERGLRPVPLGELFEGYEGALSAQVRDD